MSVLQIFTITKTAYLALGKLELCKDSAIF